MTGESDRNGSLASDTDRRLSETSKAALGVAAAGFGLLTAGAISNSLPGVVAGFSVSMSAALAAARADPAVSWRDVYAR